MGISEVELGANFGAALESVQGQVGVFAKHNGCLPIEWSIYGAMAADVDRYLKKGTVNDNERLRFR